MTLDLLDATPADLLAAEEAALLTRRHHDTETMRRLLAWCDLHSTDPQTLPGAVPTRFGGERLITIGGEGTPGVAELCFGEYAIAAHAGTIATQHRAADYLDLRHRLPHLHACVLDLSIDLWLAAKIARLTRPLPLDRVGLVDIAATAAIDESPSRLLTIVEAAFIEADPDAHRARIAADDARVGVWGRTPRPGSKIDPIDAEPATGAINARLPLHHQQALLETVEHLTDELLTHTTSNAEESEALTLDQARAAAFALLADPAAAARLLHGPHATSDTDDTAPAEQIPAAKPRRRNATLYIHLHADVLTGHVDAPARVEGLGPLLLEQVTALLNGREVTVQPVIDLATTTATNAYEHPTQVKHRTLLRTTRDVFPHSTRTTTRSLDHDHPTPYRPTERGGPPGQTGDHNDAPLARRDHRTKTHLGYQVKQLQPGVYRWITPHGLARLVTPRGTRRIGLIRSADGTIIGETHHPPWRLEIEFPPTA